MSLANSSLQLIVLRNNDAPVQSLGLSCKIPLNGSVTVGRGKGSNLYLQDPSRTISRMQVKLASKDAKSVSVTNISRSNSVFVNAEEVLPGDASVLSCDDFLRIGSYELTLKEVNFNEDGFCARTDSNDGFSIPAFINKLPIGNIIPDDVDFYSLDNLPSTTCSREGFDPISPLNLQAHNPSEVTPNINHGAEVDSLFNLPNVMTQEICDEGKSLNGVQQSDIGLLADSLRKAFARGANMDVKNMPEFNEAFFEKLGGLMCRLTEGLVNLIHERAQIKHEMRADVTIIAASKNNPVKFAPDAQSALTHLLNQPMSGFMAAEDAIDDAVKDLLAHQVGLISGARGAVYEVIKNFSPQIIQSYFTSDSLITSLIPSSRNAKLWELYEAHYAGVAGNAREDFELRFQQAFAQAYEQEIEKLCQAKVAV